jgi:hypothetical protein
MKKKKDRYSEYEESERQVNELTCDICGRVMNFFLRKLMNKRRENRATARCLLGLIKNHLQCVTSLYRRQINPTPPFCEGPNWIKR